MENEIFRKQLPTFLAILTSHIVTRFYQMSCKKRKLVQRYASGQWFVRTVNVPYRSVVKHRDLRHYDVYFDAERWMMVDAVHLRQESGIRKCLFLPKYKRSQIILYTKSQLTSYVTITYQRMENPKTQ